MQFAPSDHAEDQLVVMENKLNEIRPLLFLTLMRQDESADIIRSAKTIRMRFPDTQILTVAPPAFEDWLTANQVADQIVTYASGNQDAQLKSTHDLLQFLKRVSPQTCVIRFGSCATLAAQIKLELAALTIGGNLHSIDRNGALKPQTRTSMIVRIAIKGTLTIFSIIARLPVILILGGTALLLMLLTVGVSDRLKKMCTRSGTSADQSTSFM